MNTFMADRKIDKLNFEQFLDTSVKIILSNQMHYTGIVKSYGEDYVKINDKFGKVVLILTQQIASMEVEK